MINFDIKMINFYLQVYNLIWINYDLFKFFNFDAKVISNSDLKVVN